MTGTWAVSTVDNNIGNVAGNVSTAIAIDSTDNVHISYGSYRLIKSQKYRDNFTPHIY